MFISGRDILSGCQPIAVIWGPETRLLIQMIKTLTCLFWMHVCVVWCCHTSVCVRPPMKVHRRSGSNLRAAFWGGQTFGTCPNKPDTPRLHRAHFSHVTFRSLFIVLVGFFFYYYYYFINIIFIIMMIHYTQQMFYSNRKSIKIRWPDIMFLFTVLYVHTSMKAYYLVILFLESLAAIVHISKNKPKKTTINSFIKLWHEAGGRRRMGSGHRSTIYWWLTVAANHSTLNHESIAVS